jgi:tryptophan synthase alpha chain
MASGAAAKEAAAPGEGSGEARIAAAFAAARSQGRAALMPYMMGAYPDRRGALAIASAYAEGGADLVELGIPFSDPLADGPVIHAAGSAALANGANLDTALEPCGELSASIPVVAMCYSNMVLALGPERFAAKLAAAGAAGAIVPDLPVEEGGGLREGLAAEGLALIPLVAPTTPAQRRRRICASARGFVYAVSDVGVTGERDALPGALAEFLAAVKADAEVPVAVGFGIGTPDQAAAVGRVADGVIIGSRLVREVANASGIDAAASAVREFLSSCRAALE